MKKLPIILFLCSTLLFSACSTDKKAETADSTTKQESKANKADDAKKKKATEEKKLAKEVEKKKQDEISKKVLEADAAMKAAEANPTDENYATVKKAFDAIPGGNPDLKKRLEAVSAKLEEMKQQAAATQAQANQQQTQQNQTPQQEPSNPDPNFIDADGNGFDDRSAFNDPAAREDNRRREAEAQQQYWDQYKQQQQQNDAAAQADQYRAYFESQNGRKPTSGEIQSQWLQEQGIQ